MEISKEIKKKKFKYKKSLKEEFLSLFLISYK